MVDHHFRTTHQCVLDRRQDSVNLRELVVDLEEILDREDWVLKLDPVPDDASNVGLRSDVVAATSRKSNTSSDGRSRCS